MTRFCLLTLCATLNAGLVACSSDGSTTPPPGSGGNPGTGGTSETGGNPGTGGNSGTGGTTAKDPLEIVPQDNDVSGWTADKEHARDPNARAMTGTTRKEVEGLIDGGAEVYFQSSNLPKLFLWQNFLNSTLAAAPEGAKVKLYIFQLPSAEQAKGLYSALLKESNYQARAGTPEDWTDTTPVLGDESRIQDTASQWWINFHKGSYYVEVLMDPSYGPPPDYATGDPDTKKEAIRFAEAVASRI